MKYYSIAGKIIDELDDRKGVLDDIDPETIEDIKVTIAEIIEREIKNASTDDGG